MKELLMSLGIMAGCVVLGAIIYLLWAMSKSTDENKYP